MDKTVSIQEDRIGRLNNRTKNVSKMKRTTLILIATLALTSCQRGCSKLDRALQLTEKNYTIVVFSGGDTVFVDNFKGVVNNSDHSDGIYYYKEGELIEISGDYVIKSK